MSPCNDPLGTNSLMGFPATLGSLGSFQSQPGNPGAIGGPYNSPASGQWVQSIIGGISPYQGSASMFPQQTYPQAKNDVAEALQWAEEKYALEDKIAVMQKKVDRYVKENSILKSRLKRIGSSWLPPRIKRILTGIRLRYTKSQ